MMTEDEEFDASAKRVSMSLKLDIDPAASVPQQLYKVRELLNFLDDREDELVAWALSGDFNLGPDDEGYHIIISKQGNVCAFKKVGQHG